MIDSALRGVLQQHWEELEIQAPSAAHVLRVSDLPVGSAEGALVAAVDYDGYRHLLVPIEVHRRIRKGLDGPALTLRRRSLEGEDIYQTYADLACMRVDLNDVFTGLCADVLKTAESLTNDPVKALYIELDRWKALFQMKGAALGVEQQAGLFAELVVLIRLLTKDPSAHRLWAGPSGHRHDFTSETHALEVKASLTSEGRRARIHGLDQLDAPVNGDLQLCWLRLQRASAQGIGLVELADRAANLCEDENALRTLLAEAGYRASDANLYEDARFLVVEERCYRVDAEFPKLVGSELESAGVLINVLDVHYSIDLSREPPAPASSKEIDGHLGLMLQESI